MERAPFNPGRLEPCFCGSGRRFKQCCGSRAADRAPPHGVHVVPGFVAGEECRELVAWADGQGGSALNIVDSGASGSARFEGRGSSTRITEDVPLGDRQGQLDGWVRRAVDERIEPAFEKPVSWFESPGLMRYHPGGWYKRHADSESLDRARGVWRRVLDRDVSLLIYLNEDFEGGLLYFPAFEYRYRPRTGDLLFFPSDSRYLHEAERVESGRRYAVVSWMALEGVPRVNAGPPGNAVMR